MTLGALIEWVIAHNTILIEILIGVVLVLSAAALFFAFTSEKKAGAGGKVSEDLEATLRKVLDNLGPGTTVSRPSAEVEAAANLIEDDEEEGAPLPPRGPEAMREAGAGGGGGGGISPEESAALKAALAEKEKVITDLQSALEEAKNVPVPEGGDSGELEKKVEELQARLAEYEIIEDDIANLSMYRNENEKLKAELDGLKSGTPVAAAPVAEPAPPPAPKAAPPPPVVEAAPEPEPELSETDKAAEDAILNEFEAAMAGLGEEEPKKGAPTNQVKAKSAGGDPLAEFEKMVEPAPTPEPPPKVEAAPEPEPEPELQAAPEPEPEPEAPSEPVEEIDLAAAIGDEEEPQPEAKVEAAPTPEPPKPKPAPKEADGDDEAGESLMAIDPSKLMEEALGIGDEPAGEDTGDALLEPMDTDKILEEALDINDDGDKNE